MVLAADLMQERSESLDFVTGARDCKGVIQESGMKRGCEEGGRVVDTYSTNKMKKCDGADSRRKCGRGRGSCDSGG